MPSQQDKPLVDKVYENKLIDYFSRQYKLKKIIKKLQNWSELGFTIFIFELNKVIKTATQTPLSKKDKFD